MQRLDYRWHCQAQAGFDINFERHCKAATLLLMHVVVALHMSCTASLMACSTPGLQAH